MRKLIGFALLATVFMGACGQPAPEAPSESSIQTAIAMTQAVEEELGQNTEVAPASTNTPRPSPTPLSSTVAPTDTPAAVQEVSAADKWANNYVGSAESGGVIVEIARVVVGRKSAIPEQSWDELNEFIQGWAETDVVGELIFKVTNNTDRTVSIYPDQGSVQIGGEQIDLGEFMFFTTFGDSVGGDIYPGVTKIGGMWFGVKRSTPDEVSRIVYRCDAPYDAESLDDLGPDIEIVMDLSDHVFEAVPEELK